MQVLKIKQKKTFKWVVNRQKILLSIKVTPLKEYENCTLIKEKFKFE